MLGATLCGGAEPGNIQVVPDPSIQPTKTSAPPVIVVLPQGDNYSEGFLNWLLSLGADSNRVDQLRQNQEIKRLYEWFEEHGPGAAKVEHLFNGKDLGAFYPWLEKYGVFYDPKGVFTITNQMLRISGQYRGYLATRKYYSDYRLVAEFMWGKATWGTRQGKTRNSGLCVHGVGLDKVWMRAVEIQIAEGQTGDVVVLDGAKLTAEGATKVRPYETFVRPGNRDIVDQTGFRAHDDLENPKGEWNTLEIVCQGSLITVSINGKVVFKGIGSNPNAGRIYLQSNGAEIFFRRLDLFHLNK